MNPVDEEERLQRLWQEKEAAWAAVEKELWWLFEIPKELWRQARDDVYSDEEDNS